jgi:hypothetical protein
LLVIALCLEVDVDQQRERSKRWDGSDEPLSGLFELVLCVDRVHV